MSLSSFVAATAAILLVGPSLAQDSNLKRPKPQGTVSQNGTRAAECEPTAEACRCAVGSALCKTILPEMGLCVQGDSCLVPALRCERCNQGRRGTCLTPLGGCNSIADCEEPCTRCSGNGLLAGQCSCPAGGCNPVFPVPPPDPDPDDRRDKVNTSRTVRDESPDAEATTPPPADSITD
ncbi:unnamed protein product [Vitrella brassicaformis CCMP3155]|uniref:EGF-like domain-containing protein n=2 Tax=Vitrella brassicaformis TaxID=1169539 RepID=A0A0G4EQ65_VITBC|nr:unnamed protein product [Vitrella brassicaformis CCMP3155]|mmetsp:Transcript_12353/g.29567  ORF Transcript_12353/g.29567 Transcript_12353/m.29567 type:complete len:179 (+) Transcript_12353:26-562(+)|eukprot:CEL99574.1 unnamed protein product [Vitrella brassicaformis CCMP3155]